MTMENTLENAIKYYKSYTDEGMMSTRHIGKIMVAYAASIHPEPKTVMPSEGEIAVGDFVINLGE